MSFATRRPARLLLSLALLAVPAVATPLLTPSRAEASLAIAATLQDLVTRSDLVVIGASTGRFSRWEGDRIVTYSTFEVHTSIAALETALPKGTTTVTVRTLGGTVDHVGQITHGEAVIPVGTTMLLFLRPHVADTALPGVYGVTAMSQGAMYLDVGATPGAPMRVRTSAVGLDLRPPKEGGVDAIAARDAVAGRSVDDVATDVRALWAARASK